MIVYEIPGKLTVEWNAEAKAIIDTWQSYSITLEEFDEAISKGVEYAVANNSIAWIADSRKAYGQFSPEIQAYIISDIVPRLVRIGIKYFMAIHAFNAMTNKTVDQYTQELAEIGLKVVRGSSTKGAIKWLMQNT